MEWLGITVLCIMLFLLGFGTGIMTMLKRFDEIKTLGDLAIQGEELYLNADREVMDLKDNDVVMFRVFRVKEKPSREKHGV